jgi:hypothetical protein
VVISTDKWEWFSQKASSGGGNGSEQGTYQARELNRTQSNTRVREI